ncbi:hypothetical protein ACFYY5_29120 [Nocardia elegans]|uniref:Uncharacterized protein n=1 Tax=Nocardia elegans TaxID=300029 RepID=A0ABW6TQG5_9NOCA
MSEPIYTQEQLDDAIDNARRLERVHQALYLWDLVEYTECSARTDYERGADMAYKNTAAWLLADVSRGAHAGDNDSFDIVADETFTGLDCHTDLVEAALPHTQVTTIEWTGEVDRAIAAARNARAERNTTA